MRLFIGYVMGFAIAAPIVCQAPKYEKLEAEALEKIRATWIDTAKKAMEANHERLGLRALDEAHLAGATPEAVKDLEPQTLKARRLEVPKDAPGAADLLKAARIADGAAVQPLLALQPPAAAGQRFNEHLVRGLLAEPGNAKLTALYQKRTAAALASKDWSALRSLVMRAAEVDPDGYKAGKYKSAEQTLVKNGGLVVQGQEHPMQAYVVLPDDWTPKKTWPLFVSIAGANCAYDSLLAELTKKAAKKPYILVVAMTLSNANELPFGKVPYPKIMVDRFGDMQTRPARMTWDITGLESVLAEIRRRYAGEEPFFMTAYSGGGFFLHYWIQHHADQLVGACCASTNYDAWIEFEATNPSNGGCPILIVTGSKDEAGPPRIFPQCDQAEKRLKEMGFTQVERKHLPNRDHEAYFEFGLELLDKIRASAKKK